MENQKKKNKFKISLSKKIVGLGIGIFIVVMVGSVIVVQAQKKKAIAQLPAQAETFPITKQDLEKTISVTGRIVSKENATLKSEVTDVKVMEVLVQEGDRVTAGQVIARLDSSVLEQKAKDAKAALDASDEKEKLDIYSAQRNLTDAQITKNLEQERAKKSLDNAKQTLTTQQNKVDTINSEYQNIKNEKKKLEEKYSQAKEANNQSVAALTQAHEELATNQNTLSQATVAYQEEGNKKELADQNTLSSLKQALTDAQNGVNSAQANVDQLKATSDGAIQAEVDAKAVLEEMKEKLEAKQKELDSTNEEIALAQQNVDKESEAQVDATRTNEKAIADQKDTLSSAQISATDTSTNQQMSDLKGYQEQIKACEITAPMDGVVTSIHIQKKDVYKGEEIATIQNTDQFQVLAAIDQADISDLQANMQARILTDATKEQVLNGIVSYVANTPEDVNTSASTTSSSTSSASSSGSTNYEIKVDIEDKNDRLRLGMTAKTDIILDQIKEAFVIPYYCVLEDENGAYILVQDEQNRNKDGTPVEKKIKVEKQLENDFNVAISAPELKEGMLVVVPLTDESVGGSTSGA